MILFCRALHGFADEILQNVAWGKTDRIPGLNFSCLQWNSCRRRDTSL